MAGTSLAAPCLESGTGESIEILLFCTLADPLSIPQELSTIGLHVGRICSILIKKQTAKGTIHDQDL